MGAPAMASPQMAQPAKGAPQMAQPAMGAPAMAGPVPMAQPVQMAQPAYYAPPQHGVGEVLLEAAVIGAVAGKVAGATAKKQSAAAQAPAQTQVVVIDGQVQPNTTVVIDGQVQPNTTVYVQGGAPQAAAPKGAAKKAAAPAPKAPAPKAPAPMASAPDPPLNVATKMPEAGIDRRGDVTFYRIEVTPEGGSAWQVMRRYNDFDDLHKKLGAAAKDFPDAPFPGKTMCACKGDDIFARRRGLEMWLFRALQQPQSQSTWKPTLRAFLQTGSEPIATS